MRDQEAFSNHTYLPFSVQFYSKTSLSLEPYQLQACGQRTDRYSAPLEKKPAPSNVIVRSVLQLIYTPAAWTISSAGTIGDSVPVPVRAAF